MTREHGKQTQYDGFLVQGTKYSLLSESASYIYHTIGSFYACKTLLNPAKSSWGRSGAASLFLDGQISIRRSSKAKEGTERGRGKASVRPSGSHTELARSAHCHRANNDFGQETGVTGSQRRRRRGGGQEKSQLRTAQARGD